MSSPSLHASESVSVSAGRHSLPKRVQPKTKVAAGGRSTGEGLSEPMLVGYNEGAANNAADSSKAFKGADRTGGAGTGTGTGTGSDVSDDDDEELDALPAALPFTGQAEIQNPCLLSTYDDAVASPSDDDGRDAAGGSSTAMWKQPLAHQAGGVSVHGETETTAFRSGMVEKQSIVTGEDQEHSSLLYGSGTDDDDVDVDVDAMPVAKVAKGGDGEGAYGPESSNDGSQLPPVLVTTANSSKGGKAQQQKGKNKSFSRMGYNKKRSHRDDNASFVSAISHSSSS